MTIKITINSEERAVVIPLEYDASEDTLSLDEIQIDPIPEKDDDISKDIVLNLTKFILDSLNKIQ